MNRQTAWEKLNEWVKSPKLLRHCQIVEQCMRKACAKYGGPEDDIEKWGIVGLLHDADWEVHPEEHPKYVVAWLEEKGEKDIAHAIACHNTKWNMSYDAPMDKALLAVDELSGLVTACAAIRPDGINTLEPKSVMKRMKELKFAANVSRDDINKGVAMLTPDFESHVQFVIDTIRERAVDFGLTGNK
jgi:predicted hydrolase (HD superfamily)